MPSSQLGSSHWYADGISRRNAQAIDQNLCCPQELYFADKSPIFVGVLQRIGRCRKGKHLYGRVPYRSETFTLHSAKWPRVYLKVWLSENNANDAEVKHFVLNNIPPLAYAPNLPPHSIVLAEQEGAIIHPNSTIILWYIRESKIKIVMLPPKGHEANPTDLFQAFRQGVRKWQLQVGEPRIMVCKLSEKHK